MTAETPSPGTEPRRRAATTHAVSRARVLGVDRAAFAAQYDRERTALTERSNTLTLHILLAAHVALTIVFNVADDQSRLAFATLIFLFGVPFALSGLARMDRASGVLFGAYIVSLIVSWSLAYVVGGNESTPQQMSKTLSTAVWVVAILAHGHRLNRRYIEFALLFVLAWTIFTIATHPVTILNGTPRPAPLTGGLNQGPHASAYTMFGMSLIAFMMLRERSINVWMGRFLMAAFILLVVAYQVRTVWTMAIVTFGAWYVIPRLQDRNFRSIASVVFTLGVVAFVGVLATLSLINFDLDHFSSGRLSNYADRFGRLVGRDAGETFFGTGSGSDHFRSAIWWWAELNSHNDFLGTTVESGLVGLAGMICFLVGMFRWKGGKAAIIATGFTMSCVVSNGLLFRNNPVFWFAVAMALSGAAPMARAVAVPPLWNRRFALAKSGAGRSEGQSPAAA